MTDEQKAIIDDMEVRWAREKYGTSLYADDEAEFRADCERLLATRGNLKLEVDVGQAVASLQASPELCDIMNTPVGSPALAEAHAEIERLNLRIEELENQVGDMREYQS